jgi:hypothetical protein
MLHVVSMMVNTATVLEDRRLWFHASVQFCKNVIVQHILDTVVLGVSSSKLRKQIHVFDFMVFVPYIVIQLCNVNQQMYTFKLMF